MHDKPLFLLIGLAVIVTTLILATGIAGFGKGGEWNRRNANRMMRWRIIAQAVALVLIMAYVTLKGA